MSMTPSTEVAANVITIFTGILYPVLSLEIGL